MCEVCGKYVVIRINRGSIGAGLDKEAVVQYIKCGLQGIYPSYVFEINLRDARPDEIFPSELDFTVSVENLYEPDTITMEDIEENDRLEDTIKYDDVPPLYSLFVSEERGKETPSCSENL